MLGDGGQDKDENDDLFLDSNILAHPYNNNGECSLLKASLEMWTDNWTKLDFSVTLLPQTTAGAEMLFVSALNKKISLDSSF